MAIEGKPSLSAVSATADDGSPTRPSQPGGVEDPAEAAHRLARVAIPLMGADGALAAAKYGRNLLCKSYFHGQAEVAWEHSWPLAVVDGDAGKLLLTGELFPDELRERHQVCGILAVPVLARNQACIGFVQVFRSGGDFSPEDRTKLEGLAELAAPAFQRAVLQQRVLDAESSLEALSSRLGEAAVQQHVLNRLLELQGRMAPARGRGGMTDAERELLDYLRRSREQLSAVLQGIAEGIIVHDPAGRVLHANAAAAGLFGFASQEDMLRATLEEVLRAVRVVNEAGAPVTDDGLLLAVQAGEDRGGVERVVRVRGGEEQKERSLIVRSTPVLDEDNRLRFTVSIFTDITERLRAEQLREQFLSMVTHELRSPLAAIKVGVSLLQEAPPDGPEDLLSVLGEIDSQADRLLTLIGNLLDMAQVEAGTFSVSHASGSLYDAIEEALARLPKPVVERVEPCLAPEVARLELDVQRIAQVIVNLLSNADKYSFPRTPITLTVEQDEAGARVSVTNRGEGIPADQISALFQKFSRIGHRGVGTGLGLAISKHIVEAHDGRIWVESSTEQQVTTFGFWLPAAPTSPSS